ncbi:unnamed protein product [Paramecium sonneborni]|uniref:Uncharacterized protein n=1 Tax=Paramecium sonneborni TaxID=65129 RepID=A0A8S1RSG4_9CILI|nr:unnamed protein product [Paramecium sonneborni]
MQSNKEQDIIVYFKLQIIYNCIKVSNEAMLKLKMIVQQMFRETNFNIIKLMQNQKFQYNFRVIKELLIMLGLQQSFGLCYGEIAKIK